MLLTFHTPCGTMIFQQTVAVSEPAISVLPSPHAASPSEKVPRRRKAVSLPRRTQRWVTFLGGMNHARRRLAVRLEKL